MLKNLVARHIKQARCKPLESQKKIFIKILNRSQASQFGKDNHINRNDSYDAYQSKVKVRQYEDYEEYTDAVLAGKPNIFWKDKPSCITTSSGTTSGQKFIPLYKELMQAHFLTGFISGFNYCVEQDDFALMKGKLFYLTGLRNFSKKGGVPFGHLGALASEKFPKFMLKNRYPGAEISAIDNWDQKVEAIIQDIADHNVTMFAGTPPWQLKFLKAFKAKYNAKFGDVFPGFKLFIHSGCRFDQYRDQVLNLIGTKPKFHTMEMFPASEGFIAYQDKWDEDPFAAKDMLLNTNSNIYFEFIPIENGIMNKAKRCNLAAVKVGQEYALILNTLGGYLGYHLGDNVIFTSTDPYRIIFSGRSRFNINYVGEHMDFDTILKIVVQLKEEFPFEDFSLLPEFDSAEPGKVRYHWYLDGANASSLYAQSQTIAKRLKELSITSNAFYKSIDSMGIILDPKVKIVKPNALTDFIKDRSSVGQNKVLNILQSEKGQNEFKDFLSKRDLLL